MAKGFWYFKNRETGRVISLKEIEDLIGYPFIATDDFASFLVSLLPDTIEAAHWPEDPKEIPPVYQRKAEWRNAKLGYANSAADSTIGNYGCVVCSIAWMMHNVLDQFISPVEVNQKLVDAKAFGGATNNLVVWERVGVAFPEVELDFWEICEETPAPVERINKLLINEKGFAIIQVDFKPSDKIIQSHYSPLISIAENYSTGRLSDTWTGEVVTIPPAYFNNDWSPRNVGRAIMRVAGYKKK